MLSQEFLQTVRDEERQQGNESQDDSSSTTNASLRYSGEFVVQHQTLPPKPPDEKRIHPRRPLPRVPEPADSPDD